ncbi:glutamate-rich WD repeat containing 1 [Ephemerocybe angulata]|uniref:Glutamate-rich WD repeat containing 1 n=1 Tax=Ephemerocybe angulata TaxID=980116 RepID=A0A8H6MHZ0_9AGAR|nr:glutamate-rich WD repeat containing 1 [Tulosesus angulatus]
MSKRPAEASSSTQNGQAFPKTNVNANKREVGVDNEMGEFEDAWEDEVESDEEVVDAGAKDDEDGMDVDEIIPAAEDTEEPPPASRAYIPGLHTLGNDEELEADESVYHMRHTMRVNWPCLSFDVLRDNLGDERRRFPASVSIVTGTQAAEMNKNEVIKDGDDSDSDGEDDDEDDLDEDPIIEFRSIPHHGGVNRIRAQPLPPSTGLPPVNQPYYAASWAETGKVHIWDVRPLIESMEVPGYTYDKTKVNTPAFTINSHGRAEGFAMDWASSGPSSLRLLTGDIHSKIYLTTSTPSGFNALSQPFTSHTSSVEDIQWSPSEPTVFGSCSADRTVQIWDSVAAIDPAHESDVNVISWNRLTSYLLLSGGDEGGIKVWDLRNIKKAGSTDPSPDTMEWHPTEDSIFAASGADDQVTLWDLAVEQDADEAGMEDTPEGGKDIPSQLLFQHLGQKDVKEVHWHPQIPGTVISTAADGFNIFKTFNV